MNQLINMGSLKFIKIIFHNIKCKLYLLIEYKRLNSIIYIKSCYKYFLYALIAIFIDFVLFCPIYNDKKDNIITYSIFHLKNVDWVVFVTLLVGMLTVIITAYEINKSYKSMKFSSLPEHSMNLLIDLKYLFNEYKVNQFDELNLLLEILKYWRKIKIK